MNKLIAYLQGKKTYILAIATILEELLRYLNKDITGHLFFQEIVGLLLAMTIRHGVSTESR